MAALNFPMQSQLAQNWCWCAVSVSVDFFFNSASVWQQCTMAARGLNQNGCCANPTPARCDQTWFLDHALQILNRLTGPPTVGPLTFPQIQQTINAGRPVCARIGWHLGGG